MKAAILGTNHPAINADPKTILQQAGVDYVQRLAGYQPAQLSTMPFKLLPIKRLQQETVDTAMTVLCGREVRGCNPRAPFLMLVWLLVGSNNYFRVTDYAERDSFLSPVAYLLLQLAMGLQVPVTQIQFTANKAWEPRYTDDDTMWPLWADEAVAWAAFTMESEGHVFVKAIETVVLTVTRPAKIEATACIQYQAREWATIDDEEAWLAIQLLLTDIMDFQAKV